MAGPKSLASHRLRSGSPGDNQVYALPSKVEVLDRMIVYSVRFKQGLLEQLRSVCRVLAHIQASVGTVAAHTLDAGNALRRFINSMSSQNLVNLFNYVPAYISR